MLIIKILIVQLAFSIILCSNLFSQWIEQSFITNEYLSKVRFINITTGWVLGENYMYQTTDGGMNWAQKDTIIPVGSRSSTLLTLNEDIVFYSVFNSQSSQGSGVRRTIDGGITWETIDSSNNYYSDIEFVSDQIGFAAGSNAQFQALIKKTTDGGATWTTIASDFSPSSYEIKGISFVNENMGWAVTYDALIFKTDNGGLNWTFQDSIGIFGSSTGPLRDIFFITQDSGWAVGGISGGMMIARTIDGGVTWNLEIQSGSSLQEVIFLNNQLGWMAGRTYGPFISYTTDGGFAWNDCSFIPAVAAEINSISMIDENIGWAVAGDNFTGGRIFKTINGGIVSIDERHQKDSYIPGSVNLYQNFPNPFNPITTIKYYVPYRSSIMINIYNANGEKIKELVNSIQSPGEYEVTWDSTNDKGTVLPSGIYFYQIRTENQTMTKQMLLLR